MTLRDKLLAEHQADADQFGGPVEQQPLDDDPEIRVNGWHYDPAAGEWWARLGSHHWLTVAGDIDNPPTWRPEEINREKGTTR